MVERETESRSGLTFFFHVTQGRIEFIYSRDWRLSEHKNEERLSFTYCRLNNAVPYPLSLSDKCPSATALDIDQKLKQI